MTIPLLRAPKPGDRTAAQLWEQYQVEKELAAKLYNASPLERRELYSSAYDELFRRIPHHGQLTRKLSSEQRAQYSSMQLRLLGRFLKPSTTLLEIGAGDCSLSLQVASRVRKVYALDVSNFITQGIDVPDNFELILSNGVSVPVPAGSISVAYSNQLMEHLHPEDAGEQLTNIFNALAPGGAYVCITPSRLTGPHDISRYFDNVAKGFHLKEYTVTELRRILRGTGFRRIVQYARLRGRYYLPIPAWFMRVVEDIWAASPPAMRANAWYNRMARSVLGIWLVAWK